MTIYWFWSTVGAGFDRWLWVWGTATPAVYRHPIGIWFCGGLEPPTSASSSVARYVTAASDGGVSRVVAAVAKAASARQDKQKHKNEKKNKKNEKNKKDNKKAKKQQVKPRPPNNSLAARPRSATLPVSAGCR